MIRCDTELFTTARKQAVLVRDHLLGRGTLHVKVLSLNFVEYRTDIMGEPTVIFPLKLYSRQNRFGDDLHTCLELHPE